MGDTSRSWRSWRRSGRLKEEDEGAARLTRKRDLILAFAIVSLPLLVIAIILLAFVFAPSHHVILDPSVGSVELPASNDVPTGSYFTTISPGKFLLLGSWASNVAELVVAPFMLLFSYAVAREILLQQPSVHSNKTTDANPSLLRELMTGAHGWCNKTLTAPLPSNRSSAPLPCSLNQTDDLTNIANARFAYLTLGKGISQISSGFNGLDFSSVEDDEARGTATPYQIVTYKHEGTEHSLFFFPDASEEFDLTDRNAGPGFGIDYVANTVSMATECTYATQECNMSRIAFSPFDINNISIPYSCYDGFSGDLGRTPATGHERAQGWNMSFYEMVDGSPKNIPVQAQANPFPFYAVTAVSSIDLQDFQDQSNVPGEGDPANHSLIDIGHGFTGFALNCQATVYDVTFSLINGSFVDFNATKASPQKASIIKAPLQVGFGQYQLYQSAFLAVLANSDAVHATMSRSFSQIGMALASGVFDTDSNIQQRFRYTTNVTRVPKAPFWFLVILCLLYSAFGMVMTVTAFYLRRMPEVREQQARLMVEWAPELLHKDSNKDELLYSNI
ncbi:MAG: hypothetical protein LQ350_007127 [Teloschistes chrysophthalmus]|nr:MAG: hypothetical protein LQ350_007127 [Niorma chrysophthalma]